MLIHARRRSYIGPARSGSAGGPRAPPGTWDLGTWDLGPGTLGPWDPGTWDLGPWDLGPGTWDLGPGTWDPGTWDPGTQGSLGFPMGSLKTTNTLERNLSPVSGEVLGAYIHM